MANDVKGALKDLVSALLGISTFSPPPTDGPQIGTAHVDEVRRAYGGRLETIPPIRLRWYPPDIEKAMRLATQGDMLMVGQLNESMKQDGVLRGLSDARTSVVNFPKRFYGRKDIIDVLQAKTGSDRNVYDEMIPATEARLMVGDDLQCGVAIGEMVPVRGRDFPVLIRRYVQNLYYMQTKNTWFYRSLAGFLPIVPGVPNARGNWWVLHISGGRLSPWNNGLWTTCGRSYINKTQSLFARQSYEMKHAHPARVGTSAIGATEGDRQGFLDGIIRWALNAAFTLPPGWDLKLLESNGRGIEIYDQSIKNYNEEMATAICGSAAMLQGTVGFVNMDAFKTVATDLVRTTGGGWDHTVSTQILPPYVGERWGLPSLDDAVTVETDVSPPADRKVEADTLTSLSNAVKGMVEAIAAAQIAAGVKKPVALDVTELLARFGVPTTATTVAPTVPETTSSGGDGATVSGASEASAAAE